MLLKLEAKKNGQRIADFHLQHDKSKQESSNNGFVIVSEKP